VEAEAGSILAVEEVVSEVEVGMAFIQVVEAVTVVVVVVLDFSPLLYFHRLPKFTRDLFLLGKAP